MKKIKTMLFLLVFSWSGAFLLCMDSGALLFDDLREGDEDIAKCFIPRLILAGEKNSVLGALQIPIDFFDRAFKNIAQTRAVNAHSMPGGMNEQQARFIIRCARAVGAKNIDLTLNNLEVLPEEIGELVESLEELWISQNRLHVLPSSIGNLRLLRRLCVSRNQLRALPETIQQLSRLEELSLFRNQLTEMPRWIGGLPLLTMFDISWNPLRQEVDLRGPLCVSQEPPSTDTRSPVVTGDGLEGQAPLGLV